MPIPGKRRSRSKKRRGWAHRALAKLTLTSCSHCKKSILPHGTCPFCGFYRGRQVISIASAARGKRQKKATEEHQHEG